MTKIKMVVFDMAGTTVDEGKIVYKSVCKALNNAGIKIDLEGVTSEIAGWNKKKGIAHLVSTLSDQSDPNTVDTIHNDFLQIVEQEYRSNPHIKEMEGASRVFQMLHDKNIKVVLDTGYHRRTADLLINRMGWGKLIDFSVTSDEVEEGRPYPYMIQKAMANFNITDSQLVMKVGDAPSDIEEGHNAGCGIVVAILLDNPNLKKVMEQNPTHSIHSLDELLVIVNMD